MFLSRISEIIFACFCSRKIETHRKILDFDAKLGFKQI